MNYSYILKSFKNYICIIFNEKNFKLYSIYNICDKILFIKLILFNENYFFLSIFNKINIQFSFPIKKNL